MRPRRRRVKHYDDQLDPHFLTFSCFHCLPLLSKDRTRTWFIQALEKARRKHQFHLWAWVIMPTHAHILIWPPTPGYSTAAILKSIKGSVGRRAIHYLRKNSPKYLEKLKLISGGRTEYHFWQDGPGFDENLDDPRAITKSSTTSTIILWKKDLSQ